MRSIDADVLINVIERESNVYGAYGYMDTKSIIDVIEDAPTIEPVRKKGKWIYVTDGYHEYYECANCGKHSADPDPYCSRCGRAMTLGGGQE